MPGPNVPVGVNKFLRISLLATVLLVQLRAAAGEQDPGGWLAGHNKRRQKYHAKYGKDYVPLGWSEELAKSSKEFAEYLVGEDCLFEHCSTLFGRSDCRFGENLAMNWGGREADAENVLTRWTEDEERDMGGHFTQVVWRATHYVGCGVASGRCGHIQVCRYIKPGNCNGRDNFMEKETPCSPDCPPEGCFDVSDNGQGTGGADSGNDNSNSDGSDRSTRSESDNSEDGDPGCSSVSDSSAGCRKSSDSASSDSSSIIETPDPSPPPPSPPPPAAPKPSFNSREYDHWPTNGGAEVFEAGDEFDLEHTTMRFSAATGYSACRIRDVNVFPYDPSGGRVIRLGDDDSKGIAFADGFKFPFFGEEYDKIAIGSNGYVTFTAMDYDHSSSLSDHFKTPRISGLFTDLLPSTGSIISFKTFGIEAVAVTFENMATFGVGGGTSSFQIVMHSSGDVSLTWLDVSVMMNKRRVVGLSSGSPPPEIGSIDLSQQHAKETCSTSDLPSGTPSKLLCPSGQSLQLKSHGGMLTATCYDSNEVIMGEIPCPMDEMSIKRNGPKIEVICVGSK